MSDENFYCYRFLKAVPLMYFNLSSETSNVFVFFFNKMLFLRVLKHNNDLNVAGFECRFIWLYVCQNACVFNLTYKNNYLCE